MEPGFPWARSHPEGSVLHQEPHRSMTGPLVPHCGGILFREAGESREPSKVFFFSIRGSPGLAMLIFFPFSPGFCSHSAQPISQGIKL